LTELALRGGSDWVDRAWLQIGKIQISRGQNAAAVQSLESMERAAPRSQLLGEARLQRSNALTQLNRGEEAEKLLEPLAADANQLVATQASLALATLRIERLKPAAALTVLNEAITRFPSSPLMPALLFRSAEALAKQNQRGKARERFLKVADLEPRDLLAADAVLRAAQLALEDGDLAAARELSRSFRERFADSKLEPDMRLIEARSLLAQRHPKDAAQLLEALLGINQAPSATGKTPASLLSPDAAAAARYDLAVAYRSSGQAALADSLLAGLAKTSKDAIGVDAQFLLGQ
jgi:TolA-binding protein